MMAAPDFALMAKYSTSQPLKRKWRVFFNRSHDKVLGEAQRLHLT